MLVTLEFLPPILAYNQTAQALTTADALSQDTARDRTSTEQHEQKELTYTILELSLLSSSFPPIMSPSTVTTPPVMLLSEISLLASQWCSVLQGFSTCGSREVQWVLGETQRAGG